MSVVLIVVGVIGGVLLGGLAFTEGERREGRNLPIAVVDFGAIPDGTYRGKYGGGKYKMRANEVRVTVSSGRVSEIELVKSANKPVPEITEPLFGRVIQAQSLQVDTISGATITSKSFLKSVENALIDASGS
jgi:uncharacterized protein with FMN-binding domain